MAIAYTAITVADIIDIAGLEGVELEATDIVFDGTEFTIDGMPWEEWLDAMTEDDES